MSERSTKLFECPSCGNLGLGDDSLSCCSGAMELIDEEHSTVTQPSLDELLSTIFGMSNTELDLCLCVMEGGEQTVQELAEETEFERSMVSRHLNHLVEVGVVDKHRRLLEQGGHVYVYSPREPEVIRDKFRRSFLGWVQQASFQIDALSREKVEAIVETDARESQWKIYQDKP